jgi:hypothetical protein
VPSCTVAGEVAVCVKWRAAYILALRDGGRVRNRRRVTFKALYASFCCGVADTVFCNPRWDCIVYTPLLIFVPYIIACFTFYRRLEAGQLCVRQGPPEADRLRHRQVLQQRHHEHLPREPNRHGECAAVVVAILVLVVVVWLCQFSVFGDRLYCIDG